MLRKMKEKYGNLDGEMCSLFREELPFQVEPTEKQLTFIGDKVGGRYLHIDLIEKKLQEVHEVLLIDDSAPVHKGLVTPSGGHSTQQLRSRSKCKTKTMYGSGVCNRKIALFINRVV